MPSYLSRLLALPNSCWTATQKPTLRYVIFSIPPLNGRTNRASLPETSEQYYITTGIYRCSILDMSLKFCENFERSRISADKRLSKCLPTLPRTPTGPLSYGLRCKITKKNWFSQKKLLFVRSRRECRGAGNAGKGMIFLRYKKRDIQFKDPDAAFCFSTKVLI